MPTTGPTFTIDQNTNSISPTGGLVLKDAAGVPVSHHELVEKDKETLTFTRSLGTVEGYHLDVNNAGTVEPPQTLDFGSVNQVSVTVDTANDYVLLFIDKSGSASNVTFTLKKKDTTGGGD